jgi:UDP-N-acetylglucosamine:LPS N-acetylglucosamine transferase
MAPDLRVDLAPGFGGGPLPALPSGCRWLAPDALRPALAGAGLAVVSAGVTLLEACALGTPLVVIGLTRAQRLTAASIAGRGAAIDASRASVRQALGRAASAAAALAVMPRVAARIAAEARRLVDGQGARRVAVRLHTLADRAGKGTRHAA